MDRNALLTFIGCVVLLWAGRARAETSLALGSVELSTGKELLLTVQAPQQCSVGDLDAILADLSFSKQMVPVLSVEALPESTVQFPYAAKLLPGGKQLLEEGVQLSIELPPGATGAVAGLYICTVVVTDELMQQPKPPSCRGANPMGANKALKFYDASKPIPVDYVPVNKAHFFKVVFVGENELRFVSEPMKESLYPLLRKELQRSTGDDRSKPALEYVRSMNKELGSIPLKAENGRVVIQLPVLSREKCEKR